MDKGAVPSGEILLYSNDGEKEFVNVYFQDETFWMTQASMSELFDCAKSNVNMHLSHIFEEGELEESEVM